VRNLASERTVRSFIGRVNAHDVGGLARLMTPRHRFTDSLGASWAGRAVMRRGWEGYFRWFPDYRIEAEVIVSSGNLVAVFGTASGSFEGHAGARGIDRFQEPAAWLARVAGSRVADWRVFSNSSVTARILERHRTKPAPESHRARREGHRRVVR